MKKNTFLNFLILSFLIVFSQSCQAIGDVFKAGMWSGIVIVVLIIGVVLYLISKGNKRA